MSLISPIKCPDENTIEAKASRMSTDYQLNKEETTDFTRGKQYADMLIFLHSCIRSLTQQTVSSYLMLSTIGYWKLKWEQVGKYPDLLEL